MKTKHFILRANTIDEYCEDGARAFIVSITPELKAKIEKLANQVKKLKKIDDSVYQVSAFSYAPIALCARLVDDDSLEELEDGLDSKEISLKEFNAYVVEVEKDNDDIRIETILMHVDHDSVKWNGYYKNTNMMVETGRLNIKDM